MTSIRQVIERSIEMHPEFLAAHLEGSAASDHLYAASLDSVHAKKISEAVHERAEAALRAAQWIRDGDVDALCADFSAKIQTFGLACGLQCIPPWQRQEIAQQEDERREKDHA